jgi:hypothetical protein
MTFYLPLDALPLVMSDDYAENKDYFFGIDKAGRLLTKLFVGERSLVEDAIALPVVRSP